LSDIPRIPAPISRKLGHYVYLYVNPLTGAIFYVGKGSGARAVAHQKGKASQRVTAQLRAIRAAGARPRVEILAHNLPSEQTALALETAAIELLGLDNLANSVRGHQARLSRFTIEDLIAHYTRDRARIEEPSLLIRINRLYRAGMTAHELYDITRSAWKLGPQRNQVKLVFAVYEGVIREVYRPTAWFPAGSTFNHQWDGRRSHSLPDRWEFVGVIAEESVRRKYLRKYVGHLFTPGSQNPVQYLNCGRKRHLTRR
jgi:hypothetical protein